MIDAPAAAAKLRRTLDPKRSDVTVADAAAASGLSLADAERGLHQLVSEARGHLRVTEDGDIVFRFPRGFDPPSEALSGVGRAARAVGRGAVGAARFVVRAWVSIVLVGYALAFVALFLALAFSRGSSDRDERGSGSFALAFVFRMVSEALFWTFHPFSPVYVGGYEPAPLFRRQRARRSPREPEVPLYERVDRFFFGPKEPPEDPDAPKRAVLAEIRAQRGRIGVADVLRVTGLSREEADPLLSKLMLDYDGSVEVSEEGGIAYRFPKLRRSAAEADATPRPKPVWSQPARLPPITGNGVGTNLLIGALNAFNLVASAWVWAQGLTLERIAAIVGGVAPDRLPPAGLPIVLGVVPLVFSVLLFVLPLARMALRPLRAKRVARENGRRAVLRAVVEGAKQGGVTERELAQRYRVAAGHEPSPRELTKQVVALGGDVDLDRAAEGVRYRFLDLELEARAVEQEREAASEAEAKLGKVVFTSE